MAKKNANKINHYDGFEVIDRFQIQRNLSCTRLDEWIAATGTFNTVELGILTNIQREIATHGRSWNEEELKIHFISFVFYLANINVKDRIYTFFERRLAGKVEGIDISVVVDGMVASPTLSGLPKTPYFFLQEFKRSLGDDHDPEGQMLAAMILAQELNKDDKYIYGCWIQGRIWQFTTLLHKNYCVSRAFDATSMEDLQQIVFVLRQLKTLILNRNNM
jgi:hypothetical protein